VPILVLKCLHEAGWVHRDISSGNILIHEKDGIRQVKISDYEYAKQFNGDNKTSTIHEIRTVRAGLDSAT
jgi:serine/threonine protein kinase